MIEDENKEEVTEETEGGLVEDEEVKVDVQEPTDVEEALEEVVEAQKEFFSNLAEDMDERVLRRISGDLLEDYKKDKESRGDWEKSYTSGLDLLGFKYDNESRPFQGASSVTHPLLAESVTQFQAQAYKELLPSDGPVRTQVVGDVTRDKEQQAQRVKEFMNYMLMDQMEEYTPELDQMLFYLPLAGSTFKKVYFDENLGRAVSKFVPAEHLVVPYETSDLETCPNITQTLRISLNELRKKQISGFYLDIPVLPGQSEGDSVSDEINRIDGMTPNQIDYDCTLLECHVDLDIEGYEEKDDDGEPTGIKVPYVVTISQDNGQILSIRRNYREDDDMKRKIQYFVHYKFLPGFGFYGLGLIHTIGGLSRTATAALRQLIDAGTLSNLPAGFKARGLRIRDDDDPLQPGEFRDVDAPGGAIRDSLMPLPFKGPDGTLFQLLGFVVDAGRRFATITDMKVGDGNQQAAVGTTIALLEQGSRVMSAVHKRLHYAMRLEFKILSRVMSESLPGEYPYSVEGADSAVKATDFDDRVDVIPVSDPNVFSQAQRIALAQTKLQLAGAAPDLHNMYEVYRDMYDALGVKDTDRIMRRVPDEEPTPKDPAQENIDVLDMVTLKAFKAQDHESHIMAHLIFGASPMIANMPAMAVALQKHCIEHVQIQAEEMAIMEMRKQGPMAPEQQEMLMESIKAKFVAQGMQQLRQLSQQASGQGPDPLVQLKEKELQLRAQAEQNDAQNDQAKLNLDAQNQRLRADQFQQRLASQERQTAARIDAAMQREFIKNKGQ